jgi:beta-glucanase (GH16 family)
MLHRISTSIFLLLLSLGAQAQWNLIWSDEFNGTSIDPSNWVFETGGGGWGNGELENYTNRPANATVSNGNLLIIAKKENYGGNSYTSARMKTQGLHSWTYGKIEARIQIPVGKGVWPAFWMLGDTIATAGWPTCGEMDIMEHVNTDTTIEGTMHWNNNGHVQYGSHTGFHTNQYHTYAIEWDANTIKWLMDGVQYVQGNIAGNVNNTSAFHHPFFVLLNLAVGGTWPGSPAAATVFPDTLFVDYVRV